MIDNMIILIFLGISLFFLFLAVRIQNSKEPVSLWANDTSKIQVTDVKAYNTSCARLLKGYAFCLIVSGIIASSQKPLMIVCALLMIVFASLGLMIIYTMIEGKYRL